MLYLVALVFSPAAVLICGKPFQAVINFVLFCFCVVPGIVHAIMIVSDYYADQRIMELYHPRK